MTEIPQPGDPNATLVREKLYGRRLRLTGWKEKELKRGVSISRLPRTIQDAVWVTRQLDMRYMWVDSMCIIQDSPADWAKEAASMGDVYRNCHLAIAALGAWSSTEGLFTERDPLAVMPCRLYTDANGHDINIDGGSSVAHMVCFDRAPLHTRAWVVQERILAPRTLNFGAVLVWECREVRRSDLGMHDEARLPKASFHSFTPHNKGSMPSEGEREAFRRFWEDNILHHYTNTKLTDWRDRISRLVRRVLDSKDQQQTMALRISSLLFHMRFDTCVRGRQVGFHEVLQAHHDRPSFDGEISIPEAPPTYCIKIWNDVTPVREGPYLFVPLIGVEETCTLRREPIHFGLVLVQLRKISWGAGGEGAVGVYERVGFAEVKLVGGHKIDECAEERTCVLVV
ncbi:hypothetical protein ACJZ2D_016479 [Fusarium nematophilum]